MCYVDLWPDGLGLKKKKKAPESVKDKPLDLWLGLAGIAVGIIFFTAADAYHRNWFSGICVSSASPPIVEFMVD